VKKPYGFVCAVVLCLLAASPSSAATLTVNAGGSLQNALNAAQPGDTILLQAGATFTGNFTLPLKSGTAYITIRSSAADAQLPAAGVRISPKYAALLPKIQAAGSSYALKTATSAHHWRLQFVEIIGNANGINEVVRLGSGGETTTASQPRDIVIDRVIIRGNATKGARRAIALNGGNTTIKNSYITDITSTSVDTQTIGGWNGTGPYLIENNYLCAAGENIMFGGGDPKIANLVPSDITIRRNLFTKNVAWRGTAMIVKNLLELKNARRVLVEGNRFEYSFAQTQKGYAILLMPANNGTAPWTAVQDVTIRLNRFDHLAGAIHIVGKDKIDGSATTSRILIQNNLLTDVSATRWGGSGMFIVSGDGATDVTVDHNTLVGDGKAAVNGFGLGNVRFQYTNNLSKHYTDGIYGDGLAGGMTSINKYFVGSTIRRNVLAGGVASRYPSDNFFPTAAEFLNHFVSAATGDYHLGTWSPFNNAGTDGKDVGADVDAVNATVK